MPVSCLGDTSSASFNCAGDNGSHHNTLSHNSGDHNQEMDIIMTSSVLNTADQFAFMQQTLLLQIFRDSHSTTSPAGAIASTATNGRNSVQSSSSGSSSNGNNSNSSSNACCPTCSPFNEQCCQLDSGLEIFADFVEINLQCYWDAKLSESLANLRYQGYICPGILVLLSPTTSGLDIITDAWRRRLLVPPPNCRLCQMGLSNGCVVKPMLQTHSIALTDIICLILARLKQRQQVADITTVCEAVESDWSGAHRMQQQASTGANGEASPVPLRDQVHQALGQLIKQRRVYYTGNKGYFLVNPTDAGGANAGVNAMMRGLGGLGHRFSRIRHSLRNEPQRSRSADGSNGDSPTISPPLPSPPPISPRSSNSDDSLPDQSGRVSFNLERSQSLRISKKSIRSMAKGGSLRLSKRDAMVFNEEDENDANNEDNDNNVQNNTTNNDNNTSPNKSFERKNSFLGKLFSSRRGNNQNGKVAEVKGQGQKPKVKLGSFSAQFPPPEMVEHYNQIYAPIIKKSERSPREETTSASPTAQVRSGPNGNFVVYERAAANNTNNIYSSPNPNSTNPNSSYTQNNGSYSQNNNSGNLYGANNIYTNPNLYGQTSANNNSSSIHNNSIYGQNGTPPRPRVPQPSRTAAATTSTPIRSDATYSNPPPPLPYRPPPPNPYQNNNNNNIYGQQRASPMVQRQSPVRQSPQYVRRGDILPTLALSDPSSSSSSSSGPSSIDSQTPLAQRQTIQQQQSKTLFDDSLLVIEESNNELESRLETSKRKTLPLLGARVQLRERRIDTIHNHRNTLAEEVIYEVDGETSTLVSRASSQSTLKPENGSQEPQFPSVTDLADLTDELLKPGVEFKSLTAQKLMAGLSFNSIDTLLEVNAAAEATTTPNSNNTNNIMNHSTETVDFGVI